MFLSYSLFMADGSRLRRTKLTADRWMKQSMRSMIVAGLPITQELTQRSNWLGQDAANEQDVPQYRQVCTNAMETKKQFSRGLGNQKDGKPKKSRKQKIQKKIQRSWRIVGGPVKSP